MLICVFNVDLYKQVSCAAYEIADQSVITQATSRGRMTCNSISGSRTELAEVSFLISERPD
jgi:hypothetical protein